MPATLFTPFTLRELTLANRIVVSPMCQYSADRRLRDRLAPRALGTASAVERRHVHDRGDRGLGDRPHHARLPRPLRRRVRSRARASTSRSRAPTRRRCPSRSSSRTPDARGRRSVPWEGGQLIPLDEGGWKPVAPSAIAQLAHESPPAALDARGRRRRSSTEFVDAARRAAQHRHRRDRAAHRARLPAARIPVAAREPPRRPLRRLVRQPRCAFRSRCSTPCAHAWPQRPAARRADLGDRLGRRRLDARRLARARAAPRRRAAATGSTLRAAASRRSRRFRSVPATRCRWRARFARRRRCRRWRSG